MTVHTYTTAIVSRDFPRGFAETTPSTLSQPVRLNLGYGDICDVGINDYGEFFTNLDYGCHLLQTQQVPFDQRSGRVSVACRFLNAVQLKWTSNVPHWRWPQ